MISVNIRAQITGEVTVPADYPTLEAVISAINANGVTAPGLTVKVDAGHTENLSSATAGWITNLSSNVNAPLIFIKNGQGNNPLIRAATGTGMRDAIIMLVGCSYVTFDGFELEDPTSHNTDTSRAEWGFALLKASDSVGCQYNTIINCKISLQKSNMNSVGIYFNNHTPTGSNIYLPIAPGASNSHNRINNNTIQNCYHGIWLQGPSQAWDFYEPSNEIGVGGGNTITDFGGGNTNCNGIYASYQKKLKVCNNHVSGGSGSTQNVQGIQLADVGKDSLEISGNDVSVQSGGAHSFCNGIYAYSSMWSAPFVAVVTRNEIHHCNVIGTFRCICTQFYNATQTLSHNLIHDIFGGSNLAGIEEMSASYVRVSSNILHHLTTTSTSGSLDGFWLSSVNQLEVDSNQVYAFSVPNANFPNSPFYLVGLSCNSGENPPNYVSIHDNVFHDFSITATITGLEKVIGGISFGTSQTAYTKVYDNDIYNFSITAPEAGEITGISSNNGNNLHGTVYWNNIHDFVVNSFSEASVIGFVNSNTTSLKFYENRIYGLKVGGTNGIAIGISHKNGGSTGYYNNFISDLEAPASTQNMAIKGISLEGKANCYFNTVYLSAPANGGGNAGSAGIYATTNVQIDLKNNIIINTSKPGPNGMCVAYRRSTPDLTKYDTTAGNNCFFAGIPGPHRLIYYDEVDSAETLAEYKSIVFPREQNSVSGMPFFKNTLIKPYNLHINRYHSILCESRGLVISSPDSVSHDIDGEPRFPMPGYPVNAAFTGTAPDIGADEFAGNDLDTVAPIIQFTPLSSTSLFTTRILSVSIGDSSLIPSGFPGLPVLYWNINHGNWLAAVAYQTSEGSYSFQFGDYVVEGDSVFYFVVAQDSAIPSANCGVFPSDGAGGFSLNPPYCVIPPDHPCSYSILPALTGTVLYANAQQTPLEGVSLYIKNSSSQITDSTMSDPSGHFQFSSLPAGSSTLILSYNHIANGFNAVDALAVLKHFTGIKVLQGIAAKAADVNASQVVNSLDGLIITKRFVGLIQEFAAGDWTFPEVVLNFSGSSQDIKIEVLCTGDTDGSNVP